jgi:hypothetical protein
MGHAENVSPVTSQACPSNGSGGKWKRAVLDPHQGHAITDGDPEIALTSPITSTKRGAQTPQPSHRHGQSSVNGQ